MAKMLCVLYDDPVDGYPTSYARDGLPKLERYPDGQTAADADRRSTSRRASCSAACPASSGCASSSRAGATNWSSRPTRTGRTRSSIGELPDAEIVISQPFWPAYLTRRADRQGAEPQARDHRRHRLGPRRPRRRDRARRDRRRGDLLQQHQRRRARRDDDSRAGAQLPPVAPVGPRRRLEHRRLRRAVLRPRGHGGRHGRRGPDRDRRIAPAGAVRREAALHRPAPPARDGREGTRADLPPERRRTWFRTATW